MSLTTFGFAMAHGLNPDVPAVEKAVVLYASALATFDEDRREMWMSGEVWKRLQLALSNEYPDLEYHDLRDMLGRFADTVGFGVQSGHDPDDPFPEIFGPDRSIIKQAEAISAHVAKMRGQVYLISCGTRHKIGITKDITTRLKQLGRQSPFPLELVHLVEVDRAVHVEKTLHRQFEHLRAHGEWFSLSAKDVRNAIDAMNTHAEAGR